MKKLTPNQHSRMHETTKLLIGAIILGIFLVIFITAIQDKTINEFWTAKVIQKGGYGQ